MDPGSFEAQQETYPQAWSTWPLSFGQETGFFQGLCQTQIHEAFPPFLGYEWDDLSRPWQYGTSIEGAFNCAEQTFSDSAPPSLHAPSSVWQFGNSTEFRLSPEPIISPETSNSPESGLPSQATPIQQGDGLAVSSDSDSSTDDEYIASAKSCGPRGIKRRHNLRSDSGSPDELALAPKRPRSPFRGVTSKQTGVPARRGRPPKSNPQPSQAGAIIISERKKKGQDDKMEYLIRLAPVWVARGPRVTDTMLRQWEETKGLRRGSK